MLHSLLDFLLSRSKWNKALLLAQERLLAIAFWSGQRFGVGRRDAPDSQNVVNDATIKEYAWHYDSEVPVSLEIMSQCAVHYSQDNHLDSGHLQTRFSYRLTEVPMASLCSNGTTHVSIFDARDICIPDLSYVKYRRSQRRSAFARRHLAIDQYVEGLSLNLYGNVENAAGNYGHWMVDGIGLLYLALQHYSLEQFDQFVVPAMKYDFQRDSLLAIGIPAEKIMEIPPLSCFRFERLLCATAPRGVSSSNTPGWLIDGYRQALLPAATSPRGRRLYISRRDAGSRKFINEEDIIALLEKYGFESVEMSNHDFAEKVALFADAECIIGLTGAGLTNLMFCQSDARIVEMFPASYVTYFYASMAGHLGLNYRPLIFENHSVLSSVNKYYGNLSLDIALLEQCVEDLLAQTQVPAS